LLCSSKTRHYENDKDVLVVLSDIRLCSNSQQTILTNNSRTVVKIKGIVVNSADNKALSGSVIVLKSETGKILHTITSSADGSFSASIPKHLKINIKISYLGYNDYNSEITSLENEDLDLGRIS
jgi:hypothetical protein